MIRRATKDDTIAVLALLKDAHQGSGLAELGGVRGFRFPYVHDVARQQFHHHLASKDSACFIFTDADDWARGILIGAATNYQNGPIRIAAEVVFWVDEKFRGAAGRLLVNEFEKWAKAVRCDFTDITSKRDPRFGHWLGRRGYHPIETHYLKAL